MSRKLLPDGLMAWVAFIGMISGVIGVESAYRHSFTGLLVVSGLGLVINTYFLIRNLRDYKKDYMKSIRK